MLSLVEEQFHLPSIAVKQGVVLDRKVVVVGVVDKRSSYVRRIIGNSSEVGRMVSSVFFVRETDSSGRAGRCFSR